MSESQDALPPSGPSPRLKRLGLTAIIIGAIGLIADALQIITVDISNSWIIKSLPGGTQDPSDPQADELSGLDEWLAAIWQGIRQVRVDAPPWFIVIMVVVVIIALSAFFDGWSGAKGTIKIFAWLAAFGTIGWLVWPWVSGWSIWDSQRETQESISQGTGSLLAVIGHIVAGIIAIVAFAVGGFGVFMLVEEAEELGIAGVVIAIGLIGGLALWWRGIPGWLDGSLNITFALLLIVGIGGWLYEKSR